MPAPKPGMVTRWINYLGDKIPVFIEKHPALTLGGVGAGFGLAGMRGPAQKMESDLMLEYAGAPQAKYSSCQHMEKFAATKLQLGADISFEKLANDFGSVAGDAATRAGAGGVISEGINAIKRLLGFTAQNIKDKSVDEPERERIFKNVIKQDPVVADVERAHPGAAMQAYQSMRRFAPTLSTDPNAVTSFLRHAAQTGGSLDYQTIKGLADAEQSVQRAWNEGAWGRF